MASGGARALSGPAKDPHSQRTLMSQDQGQWRTLPVGDRLDAAPECPIPEATDAELAMWALYWRKPLSIIWSESGQEIEVALHVRSLVEALESGAPANSRTLVRQQMGELLLTHKALADAKIRIGVAETDSPSDSPTATSRPSARQRRLSAVPNVGA